MLTLNVILVGLHRQVFIRHGQIQILGLGQNVFSNHVCGTRCVSQKGVWFWM